MIENDEGQQYEQIVRRDNDDDDELITDDDLRDIGFQQLKLKSKKPSKTNN